MNINHTNNVRRKRAFSLIEMLTVIAIIGIITGIAVVLISGIRGKSEEATAKRHAQIVAAMAGQALHAGDTQLLEAGSKEAALKLLSIGVTGEGTFEDVVFRLSLSEKEQADTLPYLELRNGLLVVAPPEG